MPYDITLTVNDEEHDLTVDPERLLVHTLRDDLGYTGTNIGCETSMCGACTVHIDGKAVKSCTMFTMQADGREVRTVEDLADGDEFHPIQESFKEEHGLQCGYCTPGMIMASLELLEEKSDPDREAIRHALEGNLCRCTGYQNIVNAVEQTAEKLDVAATDGGKDVE
jgi:carbon-monoxide dehydrogenase small subunit